MNYGQLKDAVRSYSHRNTASLDAQWATFLALTEQRIYQGEGRGINRVQPLRLASMVKSVTLADGNLPADFVEAKQVQGTVLSASGQELYYRPLDKLSGASRAYSYQGLVMVLGADASFPVQLTYYAKYATPSADADTNWLLVNAPGVYLASMLVEFARWSRDDALGAREAGSYASAVGAVTATDRAAQHSGSPLIAKPADQRIV